MSELVKRPGSKPAKKAPAKKVAAKMPPQKAAKKAPAKKVPAKKVPAKKAAKKMPAKKAAKKVPKKTAGWHRGTTHHGAGAGPRTTAGPAMAAPALPAPPTDPLATLGLEEGHSAAQLRRAWRAYALRHHPDHGGDSATFARGHKAFETLLGKLEFGIRN